MKCLLLYPINPLPDQQQLVFDSGPLCPRLGQDSSEELSHPNPWRAKEKPADLHSKVRPPIFSIFKLLSYSRKFHITDVKIHEAYDYILQQNDIALIKSSRFCLLGQQAIYIGENLFNVCECDKSFGRIDQIDMGN